MAAVPALFQRIVVGVDGTEPSFEACRQVAVLAPPDALIDVVSVALVGPAVRTGPDAPRVTEELELEADAALLEASRIFGGRARTRRVDGWVTPVLLDEIEALGATVIAIGTHGHRRATEIAVGGVAGDVLHQAPCSVLVARPALEAARFPRSIVVGNDGTPQALDALAVGHDLAARFDATLQELTADTHPVDALVAAAREADLVLVGSRGLHGLRALGSVSERVAHQARCSVLVVRRRER